MEIERKGFSLLAIFVLQCIAVCAHVEVNRKVGKLESRRILDELRKRHTSHVFKRSTSGLRQEEADIDELLLRSLNEDEEAPSGGNSADHRQTEDGAKLIEDALKGNVDSNSDVVNLLESMFVDEGNTHNAHPDGIAEIASKKGKVYGDTHDSHRLTKQEMNDLQDSSTGRKRRNFLTSAPLWADKIIPYTIASSLSVKQSNIDVINKGIKQFTDYTCLKWVPRGSTEASKASYSTYIEFFSGSGCWSYVGRVFRDKQQISLKDPGCVSVSTTVHEMTHAIGQMHEQSRSDRDNHVTMLWANTQDGKENFNMAKSSTHDYNPYDYESVLQYSLTSFSINGKPTMEFRDRRLDFLADSATGLMFYDIQDITDAYDCTKPCKGANGNTPLKQCQNGGFVIHNCNCHCPDGLTGTLCESAATDAECGPGIITLAEGETKTITSPNFNNGGPYPTGKKCVWLVKVPNGKNVAMTINEMDVTTNGGACNHWLEIQYNLIGQTGPRRCGKLSHETYVTSDFGDPTMMLLKFDSAFAASATAGKGFSLTVTPVGAGCKSAPCVYGTCADVGTSDFKCTCTNGYTGRLCDTLEGTGDISCNFEGSGCVFSNSKTLSYDWIIKSGSTPSGSTGPSSAQSGSSYLYAETSSPVPSGNKFVFETPLLQGVQRCLTFWYHMYGSDMGTLNVLVDGSSVWTRTGDQGNSWKKADITVGTTTNYKVAFEAIKGSGYRSDIAIDAISMTACGSSTQAPTTQAPTTQAPTTQAPTTKAPTTQAPTTQAPTTKAPTTQAPTTKAPTTKAPTTQAPTTKAPTTQAPTTKAPTTQAPTTQAPTTKAPTTQAPTTKAPTTQAPTTKAPTTQAPTTRQPTTQQPTTDVPPLVDQDLHCTFEVGTFCFLENVLGDNFNWTNRQGRTPSSQTGPTSAFEGTRYSYIEATGKRRNAKASLQSATVSTSQPFCLSFAYHMYGSNIGSLSVLMVSSTTSLTLFDESGNKGNQWNVAYISVPPTTGQIEFTAVRGNSFRGDIAIDDVHFLSGDCVIPSTTTPAPLTLPLSCTFESGTTCFLQDVTSTDDFNWSRRSGRTPSGQTGPTSAFDGTRYAYIEASGKRNGNTAVLESSPVLTGDPFMCLSFAYHMYGRNIGSLEVVYNGTTVFYEFDNKGNQWNQAEVTLLASQSSASPIQFVGTRGTGFRGDIAVDDIQVTTGECVTDCSDNPCGPNSVCVADAVTTYRCDCATGFTGTACDIVMGPVSCTFEDGEDCFLENYTFDNFDWTIRSGKTPSGNTGPNSAIQGSKYAYMEASGRRKDQTAAFITKYKFESGDRCLIFNYHMFGRGVGELKVMQESMYSVELFSKTGQQSSSANDWQTEGIDIYHDANDTIVIEAKRGGSFAGDIALDNIRYIPGRCGCEAISCLNGGTCVDTAAGGTCQCGSIFSGLRCESYVDTILSCTFDDGGSCFLSDVTSGDNMDWQRTNVRTPSGNTGPGSPTDGTYAYIEASGRRRGANAILSSENTVIPDVGPRCLRFLYNMNGRNMGTLSVWAGDRGSESEVWSLSGDQGDVWTPVSIDIPASTDLVVMFKGIRGNGYRSDIAVDTILLLNSACSGVPLPA
ncbi:MAM and LDL-receptor class A domain-containing protein 1-like isoform X2 [Ostrea edulis]|uniref:MAM and LDL-receptor class A domain-containing protein 1-like isoform X2 n=1 Tax=Ostrea edulis TaxID=37623 RepID=UPI0024AEB1A3|nr:MAM and LDL-receptor class A domain-containing protein 1-like isoform X2 [Ostrea edulis]